MSGPIDLSRLPPPNVIEPLDFEQILLARKAALVAAMPAALQEPIAAVLALESEPLTKLLEENALRELLLRQRVNEAAQALLLAFAREEDLDHLGANFNVERLLVRAADPSAVPPVAALYESDPDYRQRIQESFERLSVAGPVAAYKSHARSADGRVADAGIISPAPAEVVVALLSREGDGVASPELVDIVTAALHAESVRPVADRVTVQSAELVPYVIDALLYLYPGPEAEPILAEANARLQAYISAQRRIGRDIRRSAIYAALHVEGVQRVVLNEPAADVVIGDTEAAYCTSAAVAIGGTDE